MENLGDTFIDGKVVSLEKTGLEEMNEYLKKMKERKQKQKNKLNNFLDQIYN